jgi:hypothetical protein
MPVLPQGLMPRHKSSLPVLKFQIAPRLVQSGSKKRSPDIYICVKPKLRTHTKRGLIILLLLHTSYVRSSWSAPLRKDVSHGVMSDKEADNNLALCPVKGK